MTNDALDKIRIEEATRNAILKHTRYEWLKNSSDLSDREMTRVITEPEHYDNNIIEKNRYIMSMRKAVF
jgi:hypothetical protein